MKGGLHGLHGGGPGGAEGPHTYVHFTNIGRGQYTRVCLCVRVRHGEKRAEERHTFSPYLSRGKGMKWMLGKSRQISSSSGTPVSTAHPILYNASWTEGEKVPARGGPKNDALSSFNTVSRVRVG